MFNTPLTPDERKFAEENHNLIYDFMIRHKLRSDDFYGLIAIGYVTAVRDWLRRPELQKWAFSTIANNSMASRYKQWARDRKVAKRTGITLSLNTTINTEFGDDEFQSVLPDDSCSVEDRVLSHTAISNAFQKLNYFQRQACAMAYAGLKQREISARIGIRKDEVSTARKRFYEYYKAEA